jgi:hypothetical protein
MNACWECHECQAIVAAKDLLHGDSPFDSEITLTGCPKCKSCDGFNLVCDEPGCNQLVSCGWPSESGYRQTCSDHGKSRWIGQ